MEMRNLTLFLVTNKFKDKSLQKVITENVRSIENKVTFSDFSSMNSHIKNATTAAEQ